MFDLVYFVKIKHPMYAEFCFEEGSTDGNLCDNKVGISPAFYQHTIDHYADVEERLFNTFVIIQSFGALGVASRFLQAATATQFAIANLFLANEVLGFYILLDPDVYLSYASYTSKFAIADDLALNVFKVDKFAKLVLEKHAFINAIELNISSGSHTINGIAYNNLSEALLDAIHLNGTSYFDELLTPLEDAIPLLNNPATTGNTPTIISSLQNNFVQSLADKGFGVFEDGNLFLKSYFSTGIFNSTVFPDHIALTLTELNDLKGAGNLATSNALGNKNFAEIYILGNSTDFNAVSGAPGLNQSHSLYPPTFPTPNTIPRHIDSEAKGIQSLIDSGEDLSGKTIVVVSMRPVCPSCKNVLNSVKEQYGCEFLIKEGKFPPTE